MATSISILDLPPEERPREKLNRLGPCKLASAELLALVLGVGEPRSGSALDLAFRLLTRIGDLPRLQQAGLAELVEIGGIGEAKAARLVAALELGRRACRAGQEIGAILGTSEEVYRCYGPRLGGEAQEHFLALALDARNRVRREVTVARGTLTSCPVHPREVFRPLIREAAASCLLLHNHPSGDAEPSLDDLSLTRRLVRAGALVGIPVVDHLIVTSTGYVSLAARGVVS
jgi:DNA repair protein RadC